MPHVNERHEFPTARGMPRAVVMSGTGMVFVAPSDGLLVIFGGTISLVEYGRGNTFFNSGFTTGPIYIAQGDKLRFTYLIAPTVTFLPM